MNTTLRALALTCFALPVSAGETWYDDYDEAAKVAQESGKHLLVDFTGSDWCHWCIKLEEEVFAHEEFDAGVAKNFVLVRLDFPNDPEIKAKVPNPERNQALSEQYGVQGFPTVLLLTVNGEVFGRTGYQAGGPEAYVEHLDEMLSGGLETLKAIQKTLAAYEAAEGAERDAQLDAILELLAGEEPGSAFVDLLLGPARDALASDDETRRRKGLGALVAVGAVDAEVLAAARELDPKNEAGLWFEALSGMLTSIDSVEKVQAALQAMDDFTDAGLEPTEEEAPNFYFMAAYWYDRFGTPAADGVDEATAKDQNLARAKRYAKLAKPLWEEDPQRLEALDSILGK